MGPYDDRPKRRDWFRSPESDPDVRRRSRDRETRDSRRNRDSDREHGHRMRRYSNSQERETDRRADHRRRRSYSPDGHHRHRRDRNQDDRRHRTHRDRSTDSKRRKRSSSSSSPPRKKKYSRSRSPPSKRSKAPLPPQDEAFTKTVSKTTPPPEKQKPNFANTGRLAAESNTIKSTSGESIVLKYHEPPEARKPSPKDAWRMYVFKGPDILDTIELGERSCWLIGREQVVVDFPVEHPSCSKQHAVIQFRYVEKKNEFGDKKGRVRPYVIDLESANGTILNGEEVPPGRYLELRDKDVLNKLRHVALLQSSNEEFQRTAQKFSKEGYMSDMLLKFTNPWAIGPRKWLVWRGPAEGLRICHPSMLYHIDDTLRVISKEFEEDSSV